jgi:toxin-antitoxin system PIN domain toxin
LSKAWLLDVNVLLAWLWPPHEAHKAAQSWMHNHRKESWATCPVTEMAFLRIVTNRSFSPNAPKWAEAVKLLLKHTANSSHHLFWQDSLSLAELDLQLGRRIQGPNQITDAYLLALSMHNDGRFVTFDYRMQSLASPGSPELAALEILRP